jgi:hypothetical protein
VSKRTCAECGTILSRYNPAAKCWAHRERPTPEQRDPDTDETWQAFLADVEPWRAPGMVQPWWAPVAACAWVGKPDALLEEFFAEEVSNGEPTDVVLGAKARCLDCPVRRNCLEWAMEHEHGGEYREGIFGGLTPRERGEVADADAGMAVLDEQHASGLVLRRQPRYEWHPRGGEDHLSGRGSQAFLDPNRKVTP